MKKIKILSAFGTRPEAVKMCPLVKALQAEAKIESVVCLTGQHREMLDPVMAAFGVQAQYDLHLLRPGQSLTALTAAILTGMEPILAAERPDMLLVHGDAATSAAAALAAFYQKIPVGHVEAGLRTGERYLPFPEEMNRCLTSRLATLHFAPTAQNAENLAREGITDGVYVTGNTAMDALRCTVREDYAFHSSALRALDIEAKRLVLVTAHRRENWGAGLENICRAVCELAGRFEDAEFIWPLHLNPAVRETVLPALDGHARVHPIEPLDVEDMHNLIARSRLVLTDSGGLQEEAPACGVPVLVLRALTERPEAVDTQTVRVVGTQTDTIVREAGRLLSDERAYRAMAHPAHPYGTGHACEQIVKHLLAYFGER